MWTTDESANQVLARLLEGQRRVLGDGLVGLYLFGSFAAGSFEPGSSDVDMIALLRADLTKHQLEYLDRLHAVIVHERPEWDDRIEVIYLSTGALEASLSGAAPAARISPGEDFHAIEVDRRWIIDWYQARSVGIVLHGPPVADVMPEITREE